MNPKDLAALRREYAAGGLSENEAGDDPLALFDRWLSEAIDRGLLEPYALTLATVDDEGLPEARVVLLRQYDARGLVFYTNYESAKGRALESTGRAAMCFYWDAMERQVRITGAVSRVDEATSDAYFAQRPRRSRMAAWASRQSDPIPDRSALERRFDAIEAKFGEDGPVGRPTYWGGYRVKPFMFEFWHGRESRLHDRLRYDLKDRVPDHAPPSLRWRRQRLFP